MLEQPVEYATKADVEVLAAEIRGLRESTKADVEVLAAEIRGLREATKADVQVLAAEIRGLREATEAELRAQRESTDTRLHAHGQALERIERQYDDLSKQVVADHRATIRWIVGSTLAMAGLLLTVLSFGQSGVG